LGDDTADKLPDCEGRVAIPVVPGNAVRTDCVFVARLRRRSFVKVRVKVKIYLVLPLKRSVSLDDL
jgi:hypothetical protein